MPDEALAPERELTSISEWSGTAYRRWTTTKELLPRVRPHGRFEAYDYVGISGHGELSLCQVKASSRLSEPRFGEVSSLPTCRSALSTCVYGSTSATWAMSAYAPASRFELLVTQSLDGFVEVGLSRVQRTVEVFDDLLAPGARLAIVDSSSRFVNALEWFARAELDDVGAAATVAIVQWWSGKDDDFLAGYLWLLAAAHVADEARRFREGPPRPAPLRAAATAPILRHGPPPRSGGPDEVTLLRQAV